MNFRKSEYNTYRWIEGLSEFLEFLELVAQRHIPMVTVHEYTENGLCSARIVDDLFIWEEEGWVQLHCAIIITITVNGFRSQITITITLP